MTEPLQDRMIRLITEAGADPHRIPDTGPLDRTGYAAVREPLQAVDNVIVTDWRTWDATVPPALIDDIVATFEEYQAARRGPVGRPA